MPTLFEHSRPEMADVSGPLMDLQAPKRGDDGFAVIRTLLPPGVCVPLHSQADRTAIVVLQGEIEVWFEGGWTRFGPGSLMDSRAGLRHALRNRGATAAALVLATTQRLRQFLAELGRAASSDAGADRLARFAQCAAAYGYWVGSREEQAAIGLQFGTALAPETKPASLSAAASLDEPLRVFLVVSEPSELQRLERLLAATPNVIVAGRSDAASAALGDAERLRPDLVLIDTVSCGRTSADIAHDLACSGVEVVVLSRSAVDARTGPSGASLDHLIKPIRLDHLRRAVARVRVRRAQKAQTEAPTPHAIATAGGNLHVPGPHGGRDIPVAEIVWVEAARDYVLIHTRSGTSIMRCAMAALEGRLAGALLRVHRSTLVAPRQVRRWATLARGTYGLLLSDGSEVAVGASRLREVRAVLRRLGV